MGFYWDRHRSHEERGKSQYCSTWERRRPHLSLQTGNEVGMKSFGNELTRRRNES